MNTTVRHIDIPQGRRLIAVSDVHAHPGHLRALLQKIRFSTDDVLVIVGDIIEKGPDSLGALRLVMELFKTHIVHALTGNVDLWQLTWILRDDEETARDLHEHIVRMRARYGGCLFSQMCEEAGLPVENAEDVRASRRVMRKLFQQEIRFLGEMPNILSAGNLLFVHGGIPTEDVDALAGTQAHPYLKCDHFLEHGLSFSRWVVVGHWPTTLYSARYPCFNPYVSERQRIISIDGGCGIKHDGQLNAVIFEDAATGRFTFAAYDDLPVGTALDAQAESLDSFYLRYTDCRVRVLAREGDCALVEQRSTGRRLWAPQSFLYEDEQRCMDVTDYLLPVRASDRLSLVRKTSRGWIVKKDGVTGWYLGRVQACEDEQSTLCSGMVS